MRLVDSLAAGCAAEIEQVMKRYGSLWASLISFDNLLQAAEKARRGKRFRPEVVRFHYHLEGELWRLREDLAAKTYQPGGYGWPAESSTGATSKSR